ncbi:acetyl-CoA hydrolase/transferase C-terminal domain-containing protein [Halovenus sp. HT40]|uniref:acetyl-CoA hydrolase/transferase C-terminal domain-containing protein n=1 Tax=Halovenus sp. HT40 TaxID=3126691 RepID=UPI00300EEA69
MNERSRFEGSLPEMSAEAAAEQIPDDATVVTSGFGSVGYPKAVPLAIADSDKQRSLTVITGGSVGEEIDTKLIESGDMTRRFPYLGTQTARDAANAGEIEFHDRNISQLADEVRSGQFGSIDVALVEAVAVGEDWLIPGPCLGQTPGYVEAADELIVEVNRSQPIDLRLIHDIYCPSLPPHREPIPLDSPIGRIGKEHISFDPDKLTAVVETDRRDSTYNFRDPTETDRTIAANLGAFLSDETDRNPALAESVRIQFGVGSLGNALSGTLADIDIGDSELVYYGEVIQDGILDLLDEGRLAGASATSLALTQEGQDRFIANIEEYSDDVVLRPSLISNGAELIERFGVIAVNSALEVDIYGHINSTHIDGTHVINGVGGSGDFNRNALVTVAALPSSARDGDISRVVPMVPHVDHTEHDIDVVVTEQGVADLRGRSPREKADELISVAHPSFRDKLCNYVERGQQYGGHVPQALETSLSWPQRRQQSE